MHSSLKQEHSSNFSNTMKVLEIWQIVLEKSWKSPGILSANMCGSPVYPRSDTTAEGPQTTRRMGSWLGNGIQPFQMPYNGCWQWPAHHIPHSTLLRTLWHHIDFGRPGKMSGSYAIPWPHLEPSHWEGRHQSQPETWFHQEKSQRQPREAEETSPHRPGQIRPGVCIGHLGPSSSQGQRPTGKMPTSRCTLD